MQQVLKQASLSGGFILTQTRTSARVRDSTAPPTCGAVESGSHNQVFFKNKHSSDSTKLFELHLKQTGWSPVIGASVAHDGPNKHTSFNSSVAWSKSDTAYIKLASPSFWITAALGPLTGGLRTRKGRRLPRARLRPAPLPLSPFRTPALRCQTNAQQHTSPSPPSQGRVRRATKAWTKT